ncbi:MAG: hypothetical protein IKL68_03740 [Clostridia bacterium]|nr:hypothetical protein [Clostridia bacterium]
MDEKKKNIQEIDTNTKKQDKTTTNENTEKNQPSKKQNKAFFISIGIICGLLLCAIYMIIQLPDEVPTSLANMRIERFKGKDYYIFTQEGTYSKEHQNIRYTLNADNQYANEYIKKVMTYDEYVEFCVNRNLDIKYTDPNKNYIVLSYSCNTHCYAWLANIENLGKVVALYVWDTTYGAPNYNVSNGYAIIVPTDISTQTIVNVVPMYKEDEFKEITKIIDFPDIFNQGDMMVKKPVIYLYPTEDTKIDVELLNKDLLTCTYPKYQDKWSVLAKPNGDLTYLSTGRSLYSLYYEANNIVDFNVTNEGFVVKGKDSATFLEEKLDILGLNEHEAEEFIIYWLPILEANKYNYIRFATKEEIDANMPLEVNPNPDSVIRVLMTYKALKTPFIVKEQVLERPNREGFVLVEWGGTEIK